jgi:hypothetical protein
VLDNHCDYSGFDFSWEPAPWEKDFRHAFSSQWQKDSGTYLIPKTGFTETKYHNNVCVKRLINLDRWDSIDFDFDYTWHPDPTEPDYIYQFGTQWQKTGGPTYTTPGASTIKYVDTPCVIKTTVDDNWIIPSSEIEGFDYTWHPDDTEYPYIYQFGTQWQKTGGPQYVVPGATEIKYVNTPRVTKTTIDTNWIDTEIKGFDYTWHPDDNEQPYIYQFGTQWQKTGGPRYLVPGATTIKYVDTPRVTKTTIDTNWIDTDFEDFDYTWHPDDTEHPYIYQFGTQWQKTGGLRYVVPSATEIKYVNTPRITKTTVDDNWIIPSSEIEGFDYTWHPDDNEQPYIYQFGTQHQKTGGPQYVVPNATDTKFINEITTRIKAVASGTVLIKHLSGEYTHNGDIPIVSSSRFISNYLDTLVRVLKKLTEHEYVWVISDLCDYTDFDFSWHPELWQHSMLHVFPSNEQEFGDTFFIHVESFLENAKNIKLLEWYSPLNFVPVSVQRHDPPQIQFQSDSVVDAVWSYNFQEPVVQFYRYQPEKPVTISLWQERLRTVVPLKKGSESVLVPRDAKNYIKTQIYDYQWIDKKHVPAQSTPLDIVFISNGESNAEKNWEHLHQVHQGTNRIVRVDGVKGRAEAYRASLEASTTDWAFCVFAKLEVDAQFDWTWQPDRLQEPKHYIFHAHNPVNGLEYGHMAMIAYNKKLVATNQAQGLDFTLDQSHEVVPLLSGVARYADDPWIAWRSAFRECLKLKHSLPNIDNNYRLTQWLSTDKASAVAGWSAIGAKDAVDYYESVNGDFDKLRLTYEWEFLADHLFKTHNVTPDQLCTQLQGQ